MKILVVDDSSTARRFVRRELEPAGYEILEAPDGLRGLDNLRSKRDISLIVLDLQMPTMDGFQFLEKIRDPHSVKMLESSNNGRVPVIFLTSSDTEDNRKRGFALGAMDFLSKPFVKGELLERVSLILQPQSQYKDLGVLVVEHNETVRTVIVSLLRQSGVTVLEAANGTAAYELLSARHGEISLVVAAGDLEGIPGDELCSRIRLELGLRELPVVLLCDESARHGAVQFYRKGVTDYIVKPFIKEELLSRLGAHLEREKMAAILRRDVYELKHLGKLKDDFMSVCSHDLKAPLTAIKGASDLLLEQGGISPTQEEMLRVIKNSADSGIQFIMQLLDVGHAAAEWDKAEKISLSLPDTLTASVEMLRQTAMQKGISIELTNTAGNPIVAGNRNALIRVFNNLVSNAVKFTAPGGSVTVELTRPHPNTAVVAVKDRGIGIPADKMPYLFERFSGVGRKGTAGEESTGLGLSITKELVEIHNGTIEVQSRENEGSTFTVTFPAF